MSATIQAHSGFKIPNELGVNLAAGVPVTLELSDGALFRNRPMSVRLGKSGIEISPSDRLEEFDSMAERRNDTKRNSTLWLPNGEGSTSMRGSGLELSNIGVSLALTISIDGADYAILARRLVKSSGQSREHLMLPSGYVDFNKFKRTSSDADPSSDTLDALHVLHNAASEFVEEVTTIYQPGFSTPAQIKGGLIREVASEMCLTADKYPIERTSNALQYPQRYAALEYYQSIWSTLRLSDTLPGFIHNVFNPLGVSIAGTPLPGVGFQLHMHTNSGQLIFGGTYSVGIEDPEDREMLSLAHAEDRLITGDSVRARQLKSFMKKPLETVVDHYGLVLCKLDEHGQLTPQMFNFVDGTLKPHPLDWDSTTLSDAFVPAISVGNRGFSQPHGTVGYVDRGAIPALEYFSAKQLTGQRFSVPGANQTIANSDIFNRADFPSRTQSPTDETVQQLRDLLEPHRVHSPQGFYSLSGITGSGERDAIQIGIKNALDSHRQGFTPIAPTPLNLSKPPHSAIYAGVDYYKKGPVVVGPSHLAQIFSGFEKPSDAELAQRIEIGKAADNYGTMPGTEAAYAGAIVKALKPRTVMIIGEHRGILTKYLAECAHEDCVLITIDLPRGMYEQPGVLHPDGINQSYIRHADDQIGSAWWDADVGQRIFGFVGDSTHSDATWLYQALKGRCDLVLVDGNHCREAVTSDLQAAWSVLSPTGVVLIDDFNKLARLKEVEYAVDETRRYFAAFPHLYQVTWGQPGADSITSNLAILLKGPDAELCTRRGELKQRLESPSQVL